MCDGMNVSAAMDKESANKRSVRATLKLWKYFQIVRLSRPTADLQNRDRVCPIWEIELMEVLTKIFAIRAHHPIAEERKEFARFVTVVEVRKRQERLKSGFLRGTLCAVRVAEMIRGVRNVRIQSANRKPGTTCAGILPCEKEGFHRKP